MSGAYAFLISGALLLSGGSAHASGLAVDAHVSAHATSGSSVTTPAFSTTQANELLVAFLSSDGPNKTNGQTFSALTGGGLTWSLRQRTNAQYGTAEIWTAAATSVLSNITVKATHSGSYSALITVATFTGANTTAGVGATATGSAATGTPAASLTTTATGSWVWGVGDDWDSAQGRTVGNAQTLDTQYLSPSGDTYWVQRQTAPGGSAGTPVTLNDTAPTNDRWNLSLLEIVPQSIDTTPPTVPQNVRTTSPDPNHVALAWDASTDNSGSAPTYNVFRNGSPTPMATALSGTTYTDGSVAPSTSYTYTLTASDPSGNMSAQSAAVSISTGSPDTIPPLVAMTSPSDGATVSGQTTLSASASDNVAVARVQFRATNVGTNTTTNVGALVTGNPYQTAWDTTAYSNGQYALTAIATDAAGNQTTASPVTVIVANTASASPTLDPSTPGPATIQNNVSTVASPSFSPPLNTVIYAAFSVDQKPGVNSVVGSITNTGTPLHWQLLGRENHSDGSTVGGDVEVWWAYNANAQTGITATATFTLPTKNVTPPVGDFQILVFSGAAPDQSAAAVASNWLITGGGSNAPSVNLTTKAAHSRVFAVFDNWNYNGSSIVPGADQTIQSQVNNTADVDSYWLQQKTTPVAAAGTPVTMNATLGGTNEWHAFAWEIVSAS